jgi:hypothetical protein
MTGSSPEIVVGLKSQPACVLDSTPDQVLHHFDRCLHGIGVESGEEPPPEFWESSLIHHFGPESVLDPEAPGVYQVPAYRHPSGTMPARNQRTDDSTVPWFAIARGGPVTEPLHPLHAQSNLPPRAYPAADDR